MRVAVLFGGTSSERNVSLASGTAVAKALEALGHSVIPIDPAFGKDQRVQSFSDVGDKPPSPDELKAMANRRGAIVEILPLLISHNIDLVFNALHGGPGEDGRIQAILDLAGFRYTGSGVMASAMSMNKVTAKRVFQSVGVPTADYLFYPMNTNPKTVRKKIEDFGVPLVVKPNEEGSTVGLSLVHELDGFEAAWDRAKSYGDILIERYIEGRELTVAVLGSEALPVIEIIPESGFYDYHHKYTKGKTQYVCPAEIDADIAEETRRHAAIAFNALGCAGYARVDFRLSPHGNLYCLEVNTLPGMTETSLVPKAARAAGMNFDQLVAKIIDLS